jgi:hypothetical protein
VGNRQGTNTSSIEYSPKKLAAIKQTMANTESRWAAKSSDVKVTYPDGRTEMVPNEARVRRDRNRRKRARRAARLAERR